MSQGTTHQDGFTKHPGLFSLLGNGSAASKDLPSNRKEQERKSLSPTASCCPWIKSGIKWNAEIQSSTAQYLNHVPIHADYVIVNLQFGEEIAFVLFDKNHFALFCLLACRWQEDFLAGRKPKPYVGIYADGVSFGIVSIREDGTLWSTSPLGLNHAVNEIYTIIEWLLCKKPLPYSENIGDVHYSKTCTVVLKEISAIPTLVKYKPNFIPLNISVPFKYVRRLLQYLGRSHNSSLRNNFIGQMFDLLNKPTVNIVSQTTFLYISTTYLYSRLLWMPSHQIIGSMYSKSVSRTGLQTWVNSRPKYT